MLFDLALLAQSNISSSVICPYGELASQARSVLSSFSPKKQATSCATELQLLHSGQASPTSPTSASSSLLEP